MALEFFSWAPFQYDELSQCLRDRLEVFRGKWQEDIDNYPDDGDNSADTAIYRDHIYGQMGEWKDHFEVPPIATSAYNHSGPRFGRIQSWSLKIDLDDAVRHFIAGVQAVSSSERVYRPKVLERATDEVMRWLKAQPSHIDRVHHRSFEAIVAEVLRDKGWEVQLTKRTRDGGYDILALRTDKPGFPIKLLVECKLYDPRRSVGVPMVDRLVGVGVREGAAEVMLVTNSRFTNVAWQRWQHRIHRDLQLIDRAELFDWLQTRG